MRTEITQKEADSMGKFIGFDPYVGKLTNGNWSMSIETYNAFKETDQFKNVDWDSKIWKENKEFNFEKPKR